MKLVLVIFLCSFLGLTKQQAKSSSIKPLMFELDKANGQRVKIYLDPAINVKKVKEISSRDVHYVINNVTGKVREEYSPWLTLVTEGDEVDPARRLIYVKSDLCVEQDYRVSWFDSNGALHENVIQRMEPSPEPWKPSAKIEVTNLHYDGASKHVVGNLGWAMSDEKLRGVPKLGVLHPSLQLDECRTLFDQPVPLPVFDPATKLVSLSPLYAKHGCALSAHLRQMTYNGELECRTLRQTTVDHSDRIELSCGEGSPTNYPECEAVDQDQSCPTNCDQQVTASGEFDWSRGWPKPLIRVSWKPRVESSKPAVSHLIRFAQVDSLLNNYPIEEFNVTFTQTNGNQTSVKLEQFSTDPESLYAFQVCTVYEACFAAGKWSSVPKHPIYATTIANKLPVQSTTAASTGGLRSPGNDTDNENAITRRQHRSPDENLVEIKTGPPKLAPEVPETTTPSKAATRYYSDCLLYVFLSLCAVRLQMLA